MAVMMAGLTAVMMVEKMVGLMVAK